MAVKNGLIRAEFLRTLRRSSSAEIFAGVAMELCAWLLARGYLFNLLKEVSENIKYTESQEQLQHHRKKNFRIVPPS